MEIVFVNLEPGLQHLSNANTIGKLLVTMQKEITALLANTQLMAGSEMNVVSVLMARTAITVILMVIDASTATTNVKLVPQIV